VSVLNVRQHANSFIGLSVEDVRKKIAGNIREDEWKSDGLVGTSLTAVFREYEIRVLVLDGRAVAATIHIASK